MNFKISSIMNRFPKATDFIKLLSTTTKRGFSMVELVNLIAYLSQPK